MNNVIEATIIKGKYKGEDVLIPGIPMIPMDLPLDFKRLHFLVCLTFAMTINKSQSQSLRNKLGVSVFRAWTIIRRVFTLYQKALN
ncbi:hypothetical protein GWI33_013427 [Rhynchophorus ferrugineus]|uniref:Uncharacterized protein n=1 Tax=Rhynchophorus ferrugineus TaxID=354439 RepID=A0A834MBL2_RHYFE|nr:hypothetical protein GWI33_013427 [Rhynchophorus ferrugineus]